MDQTGNVVIGIQKSIYQLINIKYVGKVMPNQLRSVLNTKTEDVTITLKIVIE